VKTVLNLPYFLKLLLMQKSKWCNSVKVCLWFGSSYYFCCSGSMRKL